MAPESHDQSQQHRGTSPLRRNSPRLVRGLGQFIDDIQLPRMLHAAVFRSSVAHATVTTLDISVAERAQGVRAILDSAAVNRLAGELPVPIRAPKQRQFSSPVLLSDGRVRYVGEPLAIVAADTRALAEDAIELIELEYEPLPTVVDTKVALESKELLYPEWGTNVAFELEADGGEPDRAFADAAVVLEEEFHIGRCAPSPIECRGVVADFNAGSGELIVWSSTQAPHYLRQVISEVLGVAQAKIRVIAPDIGGGFGGKDHPYPEEMLVALLAIRCGRPVKWIEDRREHLLATNHAREQIQHLRVAADADGCIQAVENTILVDAGANLHARGPGPAILSTVATPGPYRFNHYRARTSGIVTNKTPFGAYRGYGHPQSVFSMERMVDMLAAHLGLDPAAIRLRNMIRPEEMPFTSAAGRVYDSGDYPQALRAVLDLVDYEGWRARQAQMRADGRYVGIGLAADVESTGLGPAAILEKQGWRVGGYETASVRMAIDGSVTIRMGTPSVGQGVEIALAQLAADELAVPLDDITVILNDTAQTPFSGLGSIASRCTAVGGSAVVLATRQLREKLVLVAAEALGVQEEELDLRAGQVSTRDAGRTMSLLDVALRLQKGVGLPPGMTPGLEETAIFQPKAIPFAYMCQAAVIEVEASTGMVTILSYAGVDDSGTVVNPAEVDAQLMGAIAQGIGEALLEEILYDDEGQLLTGSLMDYLLPTAFEMPEVALGHLAVPSPHTVHGMKGAGEAGILTPMAVIGNAISDALAPFGVQVTRMPATPRYVRSLIRRAEANVA